MKKHRKQSVNVGGEKRLVDVPVDAELYKADRREEYQRVRSRMKHVPFDDAVHATDTDIAGDYETAQLLESLREALQRLDAKERHLVQLYYFDGLTERKAADILKISQPAVNKLKRKTISKLRSSLIDWL
jgi:RNA polymerase sigma factor (sigma-70 family)